MRVAEDRARWREIGEAYVQQWAVVADDEIKNIGNYFCTLQLTIINNLTPSYYKTWS
jgi:hypothetical protein